MNSIPGNISKRNHQTLELTLHDGLDRLEEFTLMLAFQGNGSQFEILSITSPATSAEPAVPCPHHDNENIICLHKALLKKTA